MLYKILSFTNDRLYNNVYLDRRIWSVRMLAYELAIYPYGVYGFNENHFVISMMDSILGACLEFPDET